MCVDAGNAVRMWETERESMWETDRERACGREREQVCMEERERVFTNGNVLSCCILVCMQLCLLFIIFHSLLRTWNAYMMHCHDQRTPQFVCVYSSSLSFGLFTLVQDARIVLRCLSQ